MVDAPTLASLGISPSIQVAPVEVDANELAPLAIAKLMEEAATGADPGNPQVRVETTLRDDGAGPSTLVLSIHGYRKLLSPSDAEALVAAPGSHSTERLAWRQGVRLALASAIVHAHGWGLAASRDRDGRGTAFEIAVPSQGTRPLAPATAPVSR
jgi:hypothetical protein